MNFCQIIIINRSGSRISQRGGANSERTKFDAMGFKCTKPPRGPGNPEKFNWTLLNDISWHLAIKINIYVA